jgi:hypothetical protein
LVFLLCIFGPLWLLTVIFVKDLSTLWLSIFWVISAVITGVLAFFSVARDFRKEMQRVDDGLRQNRAEEIIVSAAKMVEFEEIEDEGACYAFQVNPSQIVFVCGQDYYSTRRFPSTDFSIIDIVGSGVPVIRNRGQKLAPIRVIDREVNKQLQSPDHLQLLEGRLESLEELFAVPEIAGRL